MTDTTQQEFKIRIGNYGDTAAGKSRYLFQLLDGLKVQKGVLLEDRAWDYHDQLSQQIIAKGNTERTETPHPPLCITISNKFGEKRLLAGKPDSLRITLEFYDMQGENLRRDLDHLAENKKIHDRGRKTYYRSIPDQIKDCDAFIFFVDPLYSSNPEEWERHLLIEKDHASDFIQAVINQRENRNLPIIFIQTHKDLFDEGKPEQLREFHEWQENVHRSLKDKYRPLRGLHPKSLIGNTDELFFTISSCRDFSEVFLPLKKLLALWQECENYKEDKRKQSWRQILCAVGLSLLMLVSIITLFFIGDSSYSSKETGDKTEVKIVRLIDKLNAIPNWKENNFEDFGILNQAINEWGKLNESQDELKKRLKQTIGETIVRIQNAVADEERTLNARWKAVQFLQGLDARQVKNFGPEISIDNIPAIMESVARKQTVEQLVEIIRARLKIDSPPRETNIELSKKLEEIEQKLSKSSLISREGILSEIHEMKIFLQDRVNSKGYDITLEFKGMGKNNWWIIISSCGQGGGNRVLLNTEMRKNPLNQNIETSQKIYSLNLPISANMNLTLKPVGENGRIKNGQGDIFCLDFSEYKTESLQVLGMPGLFKSISIIKSFRPDFSSLITMNINSNYKLPDLLWTVQEQIEMIHATPSLKSGPDEVSEGVKVPNLPTTTAVLKENDNE